MTHALHQATATACSTKCDTQHMLPQQITTAAAWTPKASTLKMQCKHAFTARLHTRISAGAACQP
jgi:hypothetical protein